MNTKFNIPTILIIFGITGDLFKKKILEALFHLHKKGQLPKKTVVYGFGRRDWNNNDLRSYLKEIADDQNLPLSEDFLELFRFIKGDFENSESFKKLSEEVGRVDNEWRFCSNKLFYLSTPPSFYKTITKQLDVSGLTEPCSEEEGWTRVILEKPFGTNLKDALELDKHLAGIFKEEQIYRVDHYLAKETVRNILAFRFSNSLLNPAWNKDYIEKIEIKILEKNTIEDRGVFYDGVGALRDVGQNHALQMLALFTMESPKDFTCLPIRKMRAKQLGRLKIANLKENTFRGQYKGYKNEYGVNEDSKTETYFKLTATFKSGDFKNVPVIIEGGKALHKDKTEIKIHFKHVEPCLCPPNHHIGNTITYSIKPKEEISMDFFVKKPGNEFEVKKEDFDFNYEKKVDQNQYIQEYEQLLLDIIKGDQTLFVSTEEVINQWEFVEQVLNAWKDDKVKLVTYNKGSGTS